MEQGGREIDTQGDSFFVAFRRAQDAVRAAVAGQRALASHPWPGGVQLRVRMGLHTGEPALGGERYVGLGVHRAARISSAGHGGQVLLSATTADLISDDLPDGVRLRDLGQARLKDIDRPEAVFQLVIEGLESRFAPLRTSGGTAQPRALRRRGLYLGALAGVLAAAVAIPVFALGRGDSGRGVGAIKGNAVGIIDPAANELAGEVAVGARPGSIVFGSGALWVANLDDQTVSRIDPATNRVVRTIPMEEPVLSLAAGAGAVWVVSGSLNGRFVTLDRIDPRFDVVVQRTRLNAGLFAGEAPVAADETSVWVGLAGGLLSRVDPATSRILASVDTGNLATSAAIGSGAIWVADQYAHNVVRVDQATNVVSATIPVGHGPSGIAVGAGAVWVADRFDDAVVRIDPETNAVTTTIPVGRSPAAIAVGDGAVWVASSRDGTVSRIDPRAGKVAETIEVGGSPQGIAAGSGRVWVSAQIDVLGTGGAKPGGTARVNAEGDVDFMDPALAYDTLSWTLEYATCAKLLNYPDKPAPVGSQVEPEVAAALPALSNGGRTYTFKIRRGFRFSPPSGQAVTAQTFRYTIERTLNPAMKSPARDFVADIVGADAYARGKAKHIAGIVARGDTLTITLVRPAPDFATRISLPFFCAVPTDTPVDPKGLRSVPSAGPYYVASYTPGQGVVLKRNPNYGGGRPHRLQGIEFTAGVSMSRSVEQIRGGNTDYAADGLPAGAATSLSSRYGPGSAAARGGRQQYFSSPVLEVNYLALNTSRPSFENPRLRRAVNYAIDRRALARHSLGPSGESAKPTDQYLPPGMPGFRDASIYPSTPDLAEARRLAGGRSRHAVLYTCNVATCRQWAQIVQANLARIGIVVEIRLFPFTTLFGKLSRKGEPYDMAVVGWAADYQDPYNFLNVLLQGKAENNFARFARFTTESCRRPPACPGAGATSPTPTSTPTSPGAPRRGQRSRTLRRRIFSQLGWAVSSGSRCTASTSPRSASRANGCTAPRPDRSRSRAPSGRA